jgi:hypothetical protein
VPRLLLARFQAAEDDAVDCFQIRSVSVCCTIFSALWGQPQAPAAQALAAAAGRAAWGARGLLSGRPASDPHAEQERLAGRRTVAVPEEELITPTVRELEPARQ